MDQEVFMKAIILQCAKFFEYLSKYCKDNAEAFASQAKGSETPSKTTRKTKRSKKKNVDPDRPKKPLTPFFTFFMEHRAAVKEQHPNYSATEITEILGKQWKNLDESLKKEYKDQFSEKFDKYKIELDSYYRNKGIDPSNEKSVKSKEETDEDISLGKRRKLEEEEDAQDDESSGADEGEDEDDTVVST